MTRTIFLISVLLLCVLYGCTDKTEQLKTQLRTVITAYIEKNINGFTVDSVSIMGIDSLTDLEFAYFQKIILQNRESELLSSPALYETPKTDDQWNEQEKTELQLQHIQTSIADCDRILADLQTDSVTFHYFFIPAKVYGKDKKGQSQIHEIGFPMDKKLEIQEIDF
ncbi:MAG: hypothetical protein LBT24_04845 [Tannerella sp.]|jgi:hypothetical protein|nr:hypothetical protein [Tannerella sp.]